MITETSSLRDGTFQAPTRRDRLRLTQGDRRLVDDTSAPLSRNLTWECYPVVSLLSSKIWGPEGFAPIPSSGDLPCEGKLHRRYSHGVGFQIFFNAFGMFCGMKCFTVAGVQILPPTSLQKVTQLQEGVRRHSWALDMDGHWLTRSSSTLWRKGEKQEKATKTPKIGNNRQIFS